MSARTQTIFGVTVHGDFALVVGLGCVVAAHRWGGDLERWAMALAGAMLLHEVAQLAALRALGVRRDLELGLHGVRARTAGLMPWQVLVAALAGPLANGALALFLAHCGGSAAFDAGSFAGHGLLDGEPPELSVLATLGMASAVLAIVELVPILPLDGGVALLAVLDGITAGRGAWVSRRVSLLLSLATGLVGVWLASEEASVGGAIGALISFVALRNERRGEHDGDAKKQLAAATRALDEDDDLASARALVTELLAASDSPEIVGNAAELGAWIELHAGDARAAEKRMQSMPDRLRASPLLRATSKLVRGDASARAEVDEAFAKVPATGRLVGALVAFGRADEAAAIVTTGAIEPEWLRSAAAHLFRGRAYAASALVSQRAFERTGVADHAYNAACALAGANRHDDAVAWLTKATEAGFADADRARADVDLEPLRSHAAYATWLLSLDAVHPYRS